MHSLTLTPPLINLRGQSFIDTDTPKGPRKRLMVILLAVVAALLPGCKTVPYQAVPECPIVQPPAADRYLTSNPDERLVHMSDAYIRQVKAVGECNNRIVLINASNHTR